MNVRGRFGRNIGGATWVLGLSAVLVVLMVAGAGSRALAAPLIPIPEINIGVGTADGPEEVALSLQVLLILTVLTLAPAILILMTSFTRIVIVLSFVRSALSTNTLPPNQVLIGLALFLTVFTMAPTWQEVNETALQPYLAGEMTQAAAFDQAQLPIRQFMYEHTRESDLELFVSMLSDEPPETRDDVPTYVLVPAFALSELKTAFQLGFIIFIPFIVIDMVVASTLMSMGMLMLPPVMISLPFKILLFVMVDGWHLVVKALLTGFG